MQVHCLVKTLHKYWMGLHNAPAQSHNPAHLTIHNIVKRLHEALILLAYRTAGLLILTSRNGARKLRGVFGATTACRRGLDSLMIITVEAALGRRFLFHGSVGTMKAWCWDRREASRSLKYLNFVGTIEILM